jgi:hypothetical protein
VSHERVRVCVCTCACRCVRMRAIMRACVCVWGEEGVLGLGGGGVTWNEPSRADRGVVLT